MFLSPPLPIVLCFLGLLLAERLWRERQWRQRLRREIAQQAYQRQIQRRVQDRLARERTRRRELEALVVRLCGFLRRHPLAPDEQQLLNDLYHEYGTESHALHFSPPDTGDENA